MSEQKDYKFYVIQLLKPPYTDPEKYVCVPNSWIRLRETADGVAIVKFPIDKLSKIKKCAKKRKYSDDWTIFVADVKYGTNSYKDGDHYIKTLNKINVLEQNSIKVIEDVPSTLNKKVLHSTSILNSDAEPVSKKRTKQLDLTNTEVKECQEKIKVGIVDSSSKVRRYLTRQSLRMSFLTNKTVNLFNQTAKENRPNTSNCIEESNESNDNRGNESSVKNSPELSKKRHIQVILRSALGDDYREKLIRIRNEYERNNLIVMNMLLELKTNCKIIDKLIEQTDELDNYPDISDIGSTVKQSGNSMIGVDIIKSYLDEVNRFKVQNDVQKEDDKKHNNNSTEMKNNNSLNKIHGQSRKFILPPEYDPNDSRWTLKHREYKNGLIELIPHSRVYIDSIQLFKCKRKSRDSKTLARMLLLEIFSKNALSICSLTGKKANAFDIEGTRVRPGLDKHARTALLNYVEKYAVEKKWVKFDTRIISRTLRNKIQRVRGKYG